MSKPVTVLCLDISPTERAYFIAGGSDSTSGELLGPLGHRAVLSKTHRTFLESADKIVLCVYPTRTFSTGMGGSLFAEMAPEDRALLRRLKRRYPGRVEATIVPLQRTSVLSKLPGYIAEENEMQRFDAERKAALVERKDEAAARNNRSLIEFDFSVLKQFGPAFRSSMTRPNKQDFFYLVTKTFGLNLLIRVIFAAKGVRSGELPLERAILSTAWYQLQDAVFTIFGQTYMKFLGKLTGLFRIGNAYLGDLLIVYFQLSAFEFLNRLVLGPLGENPLVYTWRGVGLIFFNIMQGMLSGGPLIPAINKMRRAGTISHSTMMHLYQISSLAMYFGMFASYGYQRVYTVLTLTVMIVAWGSYIFFSVRYKDQILEHADEATIRDSYDQMAARAYASRQN